MGVLSCYTVIVYGPMPWMSSNSVAMAFYEVSVYGYVSPLLSVLLTLFNFIYLFICLFIYYAQVSAIKNIEYTYKNTK